MHTPLNLDGPHFEIEHQSKRSAARAGRLHTPHGTIETPCFVGVGTNGTLKGVDPADPCQDDLSLMFCNTYHLMIQPTTPVVREQGGLHAFIGRQAPIITDSGGFQVFSLMYGGVANELKSKGTKQHDGTVLRVDETGVVFRSYRDGRAIHLTPESSVLAQKDLGADIIIPLDELLPYHADPAYLHQALDRTHRWELRSLATHQAQIQQQAMWAVVHGGVSQELRRKSARFLSEHPFDGFALGGSLGKNKEELSQVVAWTVPHLPPEAPRHLLGIADLPSLELCLPLGMDTFDSAYPTRAARHGTLLTEQGPLKIGQSRYARDPAPVEASCSCNTCATYTRAYVHHLYKAREPSFSLLATRHNVVFMTRWMKKQRLAILADAL